MDYFLKDAFKLILIVMCFAFVGSQFQPSVDPNFNMNHYGDFGNFGASQAQAGAQSLTSAPVFCPVGTVKDRRGICRVLFRRH